ncbi:MarR family winged helix-turn-helix transcriptional regulator [Nocardia sp. CNY236]|uniref:MarR family winged helix-turn-helix transcriptional regulator n=1 Tax=Nocardia sp. CNY236 TaxID=1169152 RepID=UPI00040A5B3C|nr:MarR family transcriptional regulator [Nocardia sp. CNY236]
MSDVECIERAMLAIRRRQTKRTLQGGEEIVGQAFDVLDVIESSTDTTVSMVATALAVDQPRASRLVATAVEANLVRRVADQTDGRRSILLLTDQGYDVVAAAHRHRRQAFERAMDGWTDSERMDFARLLTRFVDAMP